MLAVSVSIPEEGKTINAAIADHIPVAELIPHLISPQPGQHWILYRAIGQIRPEHSLSQAGVRPGERLTLDLARAPEPALDAVDELSETINTNHAPWVIAALSATANLLSLLFFPGIHPHFQPPWNPLEMQNIAAIWNSGLATQSHIISCIFFMFLCSALSLHDQRYSYIAPLLGFTVGLYINIACACILGVLMIWRKGPARILWGILAIAACCALSPGGTLILALLAYSLSGQIAIAFSTIQLPKVPATGIFTDTTLSPAGNVRDIHAACVWALSIVITVCVTQIIPWNTPREWWHYVLCFTVAGIGLSARGTRAPHAYAAMLLSIGVLAWTFIPTVWAPALLILLILPLIHINSPLIGRIIDAVEAICFCATIPLALHSTGIFATIRGFGV